MNTRVFPLPDPDGMVVSEWSEGEVETRPVASQTSVERLADLVLQQGLELSHEVRRLRSQIASLTLAVWCAAVLLGAALLTARLV